MKQDHHNQLGFDGLLAAAADQNHKRQLEKETAHLPATMEEGIAFFRLLIRQHHAAMLAADVDTVMHLRKDAELLAVRLGGGETGILAEDDAPGRVLARQSAAAPGAVPLWGQSGEFIVTLGTMKARIELEGIFGIGSSYCYWPGFSAHAAEHDRPFLSATGFRSFLGFHADPAPGLTPDAFAEMVIAAHVARELKGRLVAIEPRYRKGSETVP